MDRPQADGDIGSRPDVYAQGAAFYVVLLKAGYYDEAADFAEWFIDTFDIDLET